MNPTTNFVPSRSQVLLTASTATGYHFCDISGKLNNSYDNLQNNHNLLFLIHRLQGVDYSIQENRTDVTQLSTRSLLARPAVNSSNINLNFSYLQPGLVNEARLGFNVNYALWYYPNSGTPRYSDNWNVNLLSGFMSRLLPTGFTGEWGNVHCRDIRNFYLVESTGHEEILLPPANFNEPDLNQGVHPDAPLYNVTEFGHCYLQNWITQASVNSFPTCQVSYVCENMNFVPSGSGMDIPGVNTQTRQPINNGMKFNIPELRDLGGNYIIKPGDITVSISPSGLTDITGIGLNFDNLFVTDYNIEVSFQREPLTSLGYKLPIDRQINFPVFASFNFSIRSTELESGNFINFLNLDSGYNVTIELKNPCDAPYPQDQVTTGPRHSGPTRIKDATAIRYDFRGAKFEGISYNHPLFGSKTATLNFLQEIDVDAGPYKSLFISGLLGQNVVENYLLDESGYYVLDETNSPIVTNLIPIFG